MATRSKFESMTYEELCLLWDEFYLKNNRYPNWTNFQHDSNIPSWRRVEIICEDRLNEFRNKYGYTEMLNKKVKKRGKGTVSGLRIKEYLRNCLVKWRQESINKSNGKCVISGLPFDDIHHLYPFNKIVEETFQSVDIDFKYYVREYSKEELKILVNIFLEIHSKYGLGMCLTENIHAEFHDLFGFDTDENDFNQFKDYKENKINLDEIELKSYYKFNNVKEDITLSLSDMGEIIKVKKASQMNLLYHLIVYSKFRSGIHAVFSLTYEKIGEQMNITTDGAYALMKRFIKENEGIIDKVSGDMKIHINGKITGIPNKYKLNFITTDSDEREKHIVINKNDIPSLYSVARYFYDNKSIRKLFPRGMDTKIINAPPLN